MHSSIFKEYQIFSDAKGQRLHGCNGWSTGDSPVFTVCHKLSGMAYCKAGLADPFGLVCTFVVHMQQSQVFNKNAQL